MPTLAEAEALLVQLDAPLRLIGHGRLVLEAADALLTKMKSLALTIDEPLVRAGAMLHDVGKILHPAELVESGARDTRLKSRGRSRP